MSEHGDPLPLPMLRSLDQLRADPEFSAEFDGHVAVALVPYVPPGKSAASAAARAQITQDAEGHGWGY